MDNEEIYRIGSMSRSGSKVWSGDQIFSRSSREEDDEESLKWAAIEKLPTFTRVRRGILPEHTGLREVDIRKLGFHEKRDLIERLVKATEEDNEKFLKKLKNRFERVGISFPTIEVRFEHLTIDAEAYVGSRALPSIPNFFYNIFEEMLHSLHILPNTKKSVSILHDISGIIKPCRMTLLLAPPGSGKTTLLLALSGKLASDLKVSGRITYNGHDMNEFVPQRSSAYISQNDVHLGEMTIRETLSFSARCQGVGSRYQMLTELARREKEANIKPEPDIDLYIKSSSLDGQQESVVTDYILKILGLDICSETMVGNQMFRGISGGEKKRVTTGEMLVGPARALFMDEISTGLDTSTTFQIINSIRQSVHILGGTALIALLQPAPETYDLFDDIILLSDGKIVYQGPRENVVEFFESMGFRCPERKGVADFLQEVTSRKDQEQYWMDKDRPYKYISVEEFSDAFHSFHIGRQLGDELSIPFNKNRSHPAALTTSRYGTSKKELLKACFSRELLLMKRNSFVYVFKMIQKYYSLKESSPRDRPVTVLRWPLLKIIIIASIVSTVFLRTKMNRNSIDDGGVYLGALFFGILINLFNGYAELSMSLAKLPVFYKQRDLLFFPPWAYALPAWILKIPISVSESIIWTGVTYYVIGYDPNVGRLFKQCLLFLLVNQMASGLFRLIGAVARNIVIALTLGSFVLLILLSLGGFLLSRVNIEKWWIWGYWLSPLMYAQNALSVNEFLSKSWSHVLPGTSQPLGVILLKSRGIFTHTYWYWIGATALLGYVFLLNGLHTMALTYLSPFSKVQIQSEETLKEKQVNRIGQIDDIELPNKSNETKDDSFSIPIDNHNTSSSTREINGNREKGMILPFEPHSIVFDGIKYSVDMPKEMKISGVQEDKLDLLKGITGAFRPGILTALMGVSGAGKTTLMDVLSGRKTGGYIEGTITISGYPKKQETFARIAGYCEQNDIHSPHVTVYESLLFSAWLRLATDDIVTRKMFIEEVMELVELTNLREALVGLPGISGLSTEQRKRLTIAVELVSNPSIIFMDEPTSGLDARAAAVVMRTVRNTVDTGRTVVCTIHQPSIDIFESFDELLLLKRGGEEIYVGPLGCLSCDLIRYFERIPGVRKIPEGYNPATWMLEITTKSQEDILGVDFATIYSNSELFERNKALISELSKPLPGSKDIYFPSQYSRSFISQCLACLWKQQMSYWRNPSYSAVRIIFTTIIALMFGTIFWRRGATTRRKQDLFNAMGSIYSAVLFIGIQNSMSVQPVVAVERTVFYRERAAGMYSAFPYAFGQVVIEFPYVLIQTTIYAIIVYSMIAFEWNAAKFFWYLVFMYFTLLYFTFYGMMAAGLTPNADVASIVSSAFYEIWNVVAGFLIPRTRIPIWWRWSYWVCPVAWTLYGLISSQFGDLQNRLETQETVADFVESYFGYRRDLLGAILAGVIGFCVLFSFVFALSIKVLNFQRR